MKCDKIRKLVIADYIDGELESALKEKVEEHLKGCRGCAEFASSVRTYAVEPFGKARREKVPEEVWEKVKGAVTVQEREGVLEGIRGALEEVFGAVKPRYAMAAVATVCLFVVIIFGVSSLKKEMLNSYLMEQVDFMVSLSANGTNSNTAATEDFGTDIEEFLL